MVNALDDYGSSFSACPPSDISRLQEDRLRRFIRHARGSVSYYGNQFEKLLGDEASFFDRWREMPILTKTAVRDEFERLISYDLPINAGSVRTGYTTGGTGTPLKFLRSEHSDRVNKAMNAHLYRACNMDPDKTLLMQIVQGGNEAPSHKSNRPWHPDGGSGRRHLVTAGQVEDHFRKVTEIKPDYLKSYPLTLAAQAELARDTGADIRFDLILSNGATLDDWIRRICNDVFGSEIIDVYGTKETGLIAYQCRKCGEFHMFHENAFTELIKDNGEPAEPGETGKVIVTPFHNDAMPMVRYDVGDQAVRGAGSSVCSTQPFTLESILGRTKSNFLRPDGSVFAPRLSHEKAVRAGIRRYRVVQIDRQRIEFNYLPVIGEIADNHVLIDFLRDQIGQEFEYILKRVEQSGALDHPKLLTFESLAQ